MSSAAPSTSLALTNGPPLEDQLCEAARAGHFHQVQELIDSHCADVNMKVDGATPLMYACMADSHTPMELDKSQAVRLRTVNALLARGAEIHALGPSGWTPLHFAAFYVQDEIVHVLLDARGDLHKLDEAGRKPSSWIRYADSNKDHQRYLLKSLYKIGLELPVDKRVVQGLVSNRFHSPILAPIRGHSNEVAFAKQ